MTTDKELNKLKKIAYAYRIGIRFTAEPRYVNTNKKHSIHKSYIEMDLRIHDLIFQPQSGHRALSNRVARHVAHELGHFLVAPGGRRYRKDFGIPEVKRSRASGERWELDEYKAQLVDNYILRLCGFEKRFRLPKNPLWRECKKRNYIALQAKEWWDTKGKFLIEKELAFV